MWFKFAAIAAFVFHRADVVNAASQLSRQKALHAVDFWLNKPALRGTPIHKNWQTETGQSGDTLLKGQTASVAATDTPKSLAPGPLQDDWIPTKHKAGGLKPDHPVNRNYK